MLNERMCKTKEEDEWRTAESPYRQVPHPLGRSIQGAGGERAGGQPVKDKKATDEGQEKRYVEGQDDMHWG
jgi:hypothetical protein